MLSFFHKKKVSIGQLRFDCDSHTHLLPGVDDGQYEYQTAVETLAIMGERGVKKVYVTPHVIAGLYNSPVETFKSKFSQLQKSCISYGMDKIMPEIALGSEYMCDDQFEKSIEKGVDDLFVIKGDRVLIEMSYYSQSPQIFDVVFILQSNGFTPILAHPERYPYWNRKWDMFDKLRDMGCEFQLNLLSLSGVYGKESKEIISFLMAHGFYSHIGTDLHSPNQYEIILSSDFEESLAKSGEESGLWRIVE